MVGRRRSVGDGRAATVGRRRSGGDRRAATIRAATEARKRRNKCVAPNENRTLISLLSDQTGAIYRVRFLFCLCFGTCGVNRTKNEVIKPLCMFCVVDFCKMDGPRPGKTLEEVSVLRRFLSPEVSFLKLLNII